MIPEWMIHGFSVELLVGWLVFGYLVSLFFRWSMRELFEYDAVRSALFLVSVVIWPLTLIVGIVGSYFIDNDSNS